jgi:hypothetical protein
MSYKREKHIEDRFLETPFFFFCFSTDENGEYYYPGMSTCQIIGLVIDFILKMACGICFLTCSLICMFGFACLFGIGYPFYMIGRGIAQWVGEKVWSCSKWIKNKVSLCTKWIQRKLLNLSKEKCSNSAECENLIELKNLSKEV